MTHVLHMQTTFTLYHCLVILLFYSVCVCVSLFKKKLFCFIHRYKIKIRTINKPLNKSHVSQQQIFNEKCFLKFKKKNIILVIKHLIEIFKKFPKVHKHIILFLFILYFVLKLRILNSLSVCFMLETMT